MKANAEVADEDLRSILVEIAEKSLIVGEVAALQVAVEGRWDLGIKASRCVGQTRG